jgi:dihydroxyacid dehydratase/phosphogluconate dehydratase
MEIIEPIVVEPEKPSKYTLAIIEINKAGGIHAFTNGLKEAGNLKELDSFTVLNLMKKKQYTWDEEKWKWTKQKKLTGNTSLPTNTSGQKVLL